MSDEFERNFLERNFLERGEIGAAVVAYWRGEKVVDLWGGRRAPGGDAPWDEDTMVLVNSTIKGLAAMTVAVANSRGWIDYDAPVAGAVRDFGIGTPASTHIAMTTTLGPSHQSRSAGMPVAT